jgi:serine protease AprX
MTSCPLCARAAPKEVLREAGWLDRRTLARLMRAHPRWRRDDGACPACVQEALLETLIDGGRDALEGRVQSVWPLDARAAFGAIPTPLRLRADPRYTGRGQTIALVDAGFCVHPDLVRPANRVRAWIDASSDAIEEHFFSIDDVPGPPRGSRASVGAEWHGLMTSVSAAGNGWLSHGLYRGIAPASDIVLVQVSDGERITTDAIARALGWLRAHRDALTLSVVSLSVAGEAGEGEAIDTAVSALVRDGITVIAAAGNDGVRRLVPPATAADAITVGGVDDRNVLASTAWQLWHSNYGATDRRVPKPEVVAPSIWTVAPVLPGSDVAKEAARLFDARAAGAGNVESRIEELRLVTPHYQHVEGTSFAAPIVASIVACMREANPALLPRRIKELLMMTATRIPDAPDERQGAGAVDAGLAVAAALADAQMPRRDVQRTPRANAAGIEFVLHDRTARSVSVLGSWNDWRSPGIEASQVEDGLWRAVLPPLPPGEYRYKFLLDRSAWLLDPSNPERAVDDEGRVNSAFAAL